MSTQSISVNEPQEPHKARKGLRRGRIRGPWAYLIVATPVIVFLYAAVYAMEVTRALS